MEDLRYIVSLGFSGADVWRAVIITFFLAMAVGKRAGMWTMGLIALFLDQIAWPLIGQSVSGASIHTIYASIGALFETLGDNLGVYTVRYLGLSIMIGVFVAVRKRIHDGVGAGSGKPARA